MKTGQKHKKRAEKGKPEDEGTRRERVDKKEEEGWLILRRAGISADQIADGCSVSVGKVWEVFRRADAEGRAPAMAKTGADYIDPPAVPIFPIGPFTPSSECRHKGPIEPGSEHYCPICDKHGMDGRHPSLVRNPVEDPPPEPKGDARMAKRLAECDLTAFRGALYLVALAREDYELCGEIVSSGRSRRSGR